MSTSFRRKRFPESVPTSAIDLGEKGGISGADGGISGGGDDAKELSGSLD